jgi:hypothetical protein
MKTALISVFIIWLSVNLSNGQSNPESGCTSYFDPQLKKNVYQFVDEYPEFPGGLSELGNFIMRNVHQAKTDTSEALIATINLEMIIDADGKVINPAIKGVDVANYASTHKEFIRVVKTMPKWKPGRCDGKRVPVKYFLPLYVNWSED